MVAVVGAGVADGANKGLIELTPTPILL